MGEGLKHTTPSYIWRLVLNMMGARLTQNNHDVLPRGAAIIIITSKLIQYKDTGLADKNVCMPEIPRNTEIPREC